MQLMLIYNSRPVTIDRMKRIVQELTDKDKKLEFLTTRVEEFMDFVHNLAYIDRKIFFLRTLDQERFKDIASSLEDADESLTPRIVEQRFKNIFINAKEKFLPKKKRRKEEFVSDQEQKNPFCFPPVPLLEQLALFPDQSKEKCAPCWYLGFLAKKRKFAGGGEIRKIRERLRLNQEAFGKWFKMAPTSFLELEKNEKMPHPPVWPKLILLLGYYPFPVSTLAEKIIFFQRAEGLSMERISYLSGIGGMRIDQIRAGTLTEADLSLRMKTILDNFLVRYVYPKIERFRKDGFFNTIWQLG